MFMVLIYIGLFAFCIYTFLTGSVMQILFAIYVFACCVYAIVKTVRCKVLCRKSPEERKEYFEKIDNKSTRR